MKNLKCIVEWNAFNINIMNTDCTGCGEGKLIKPYTKYVQVDEIIHS